MSNNSLVTVPVLNVEGPLVVSDPCYLKGELRFDGNRNSALKFDDVADGRWVCGVLVTENTQGWGPRVEKLVATHPDYRSYGKYSVGWVPVDSGQMSILAEAEIKNFEDDNDVSWSEESIQEKRGDFSYQGACQATLGEAHGGVIGDGRMLVSSTGYGDGQYEVHVWQNAEGRVFGIEIDFIPEEDDEDDTEWADDGEDEGDE